MLVRCLAMMALLVLAAGLLALAAPQTPQATAVLVENFEDGIGAWTTNDGKAAGDPDKVTLCTLSEVTPGAPGMGGARCALVEFQAAQDTWASITLPVKGALWARNGCTQLRLMIKGDGSKAPVKLALRVIYQSEKERRDLSFYYLLNLESWDWRTAVIPLAKF